MPPIKRVSRASLATISVLGFAGLFSLFLAACHKHDYSYLNASDDGGNAGSPDALGSDLAKPAPDGGNIPPGLCPTVFTYHPSGGMTPGAVSVSGEWTDWKVPGVVLASDGAGGFSATVALAPGLYGYKVIVDGVWMLDPAVGPRKYVGGVENSAMSVADCALPVLSLATKTITRPAADMGRLVATVRFQKGQGGADLDGSTIKATLRKSSATTALPAPLVDAAGIHLDVSQLADGKYTVFVDAADKGARAAKTLRLVFWIEAEAFDWRDAVIYMAMADRFGNGDKTNDAKPSAGVDVRADFQGGDLQGITAQITSGYFDQLGVRALWISPYHQNPQGAYPAADGVHQVTGYHGYWPVKARGVEPRIGGDGALLDLVAEAHKHGIRVLQDFVVNHVHQEHEYFKAHPDWFRTGCVCGTQNCDWTTHRLDCLFAPYLPDVNWTVPEVSAQYGDDVVWWLDKFDLDGLRVDAVKHVEDAAVLNLSARIRKEFEAAGTPVFLTGETAMGWSDCGNCNAEQYATISRYIGPMALHGQADFVMYYAVPMQVYASDTRGMLHADYWTGQSQSNYPAGAIMTPYVGTQDTARFVTLATYRGQDQKHDQSIPGNQWSNIAGPPTDSEPYGRLQLAQSWLLTIPGAPVIYYGDEYGEWGGADPNNRVMWRGAGSLSSDESKTLANARALGTARKQLSALRRGTLISIFANEAVALYARQDAAGPNKIALIALNRTATQQTFTAPLPMAMAMALGIAPGTTLTSKLGGMSVTTTMNGISLTLDPHGSAILAP